MFISKIMLSIIHKWAMFQFPMLNNQRVTAWELGGLFATKGRREAADAPVLPPGEALMAGGDLRTLHISRVYVLVDCIIYIYVYLYYPYDIYIIYNIYIDTCCVLIDLSMTILSKLGSTERDHLGINQLS